MNLVLLGYPGSGKGTQAKALAAKRGFTHISTGDLFREEISKNTDLGTRVKGYISQGKLVPDGVVLDVIENRIKTLKGNILFDGFPRTVEQAEGLERMLEKYSMQTDGVLFFEVNEKEVAKRISARRFCAKCGAIYNVLSSPPKTENKCDSCASPLSTREDDRQEVVLKRIEVYKDLTSPLVSYYRTQGVFHVIDASLGQDEVYAQIEKAVESKAGY
ncbi:MAG: adenylate kinase [Elusimicrobia bacterium CG08_land_8_20_14_0_20_51_18]|nr:MAG: adenylate kinase [Elusimicrobia bacterium CG08_land_8_20_14_0_20_51_18]